MSNFSSITLIIFISIFLGCGSSDSSNQETPVSIEEPTEAKIETFNGDFNTAYASSIPSDSTKKLYDNNRFSVITGEIKDKDDNPLSGVSVTLKLHPEYGSVLSDEQGRFEIATEGGNTQTLRYLKTGYTPIHRIVQVIENDIAVAPSITMLEVDSKVTKIDLTTSAVQTHQSSIIPGNGSNEEARSTTLVFDGVHSAKVTYPDGSFETLYELNVRGTEFVTPESMPSDLPPTTAFTYCIDLTVDEVSDEEATVTFNAPVIMYVDNFLGFEVGEIIPVGYYDQAKAQWISDFDGVVVKLLDTDGDNIVDALDYTGDDLPDDFNDNGITTDEANGLENNTVYQAGSLMWRASIKHFTPWDLNLAYSINPKDQAPNNTQASMTGSQASGGGNQANSGGSTNSCDTLASYVQTSDQSFHEDISIPGLSQKLWYTSSDSSHFTKVTVPASGNTISDTLLSIIVKMEISGKVYSQTLPAQANQEAIFIWDKKDYRDLKVFGVTKAKISIGYKYNLNYRSANTEGGSSWLNTTRSFGRVGNADSFVRGRSNYISWQKYTSTVNGFSPFSNIGENWSFSIPYYLDINHSMLYKGNGAIESISQLKPVSKLLDLEDIEKIRFDLFGNLFILQSNQHKVLKLDKSGNLTTYAGTGIAGYNGDNQKATQALLNFPSDIALDNEGNLYIADYTNDRIRKVTRDGIITSIVQKFAPSAIKISSDNTIYLTSKTSASYKIIGVDFLEYISADQIQHISENKLFFVGDMQGYYRQDNYLVYSRIDRTKLDSIGQYYKSGNAGDGANAKDALLSTPTDIAEDKAGNIYIADYGNGSIRKVDSLWNISTILGSLPSDDNAYFESNLIKKPVSLATYNGKLYVADTQAKAIFMVDLTSLNPENTYETYSEDYLIKSGNIGHIFNKEGRHTKDIDLKTGKTLNTYTYKAYEVSLASLLATDENPNPDILGVQKAYHLSSITNRFNESTKIERDENAQTTAIISPEGDRTDINFDNDGLSSITYPDGATHSFSYDEYGRMLQMVKPGGSIFNIEYNEAGEVIKFSDAEDGTWSYNSNSDINNADTEQVWTTTTAEGNTRINTRLNDTTAISSTKLAYDGTLTQSSKSLNDESSTFNTCGVRTSNTYDNDPYTGQLAVNSSTTTMPSGLSQNVRIDKSYETTTDGLIAKKTTMIDNNGYLSTSVYQNNQTTITSPKGRTAKITYDAQSLLPTTVQAGNLYPINYSYDEKGRVTRVSQGSRSSRYSYDAKGNLHTSIDPDGDQTSFNYDVMHRPTTTNLADGHTIQMLYNERSTLKNLKTPTKGDFGFTYNKLDYVTEEKAPSGARTTYEYNKERALTKISTPSNKVINYTYTKTNLTQMSRPEGNTYYSYGCGSKLESAYSGGEGISYSYDGNLLKSFSYIGTLSQAIAFEYDNFFRAKSISYAGLTENSAYDADGLLIKTGEFTINRDNSNGQAFLVSDGGLNLSRNFNNYGELDQETYNVNDTSYSYKVLERTPSGKIKTKIEQLGNDSVMYNYDYDQRGRLTEVKQDNEVVETYVYDANGNRIAMDNKLTNENTQAYYRIDDTIEQFGKDSYHYNVDGYLETKTNQSGTSRYSYGSLGELKEVTLANGDIISYQHNVNNQRVAKLKNGEIVEKYLWLDLTTLLATYDEDNNLKQRYNYADGRMPVSYSEDGNTYYIAYNQVGSPRAIMDEDGNIIKAITYDSFGNIITDTNPSMKIAFGFAGGLYDSDTKLNRFGYRDYDSHSGKWTSKDPIGLAGGDSNVLAYVGGDPVNFVDLNGEAKRRVPIANNWFHTTSVRNLLSLIKKREANFAWLRNPGPYNQRDVNFLKQHLRTLEEKNQCATNFTPFGWGRNGAFNAAKQLNGIPRSQQPERVGPNYDLRGNLQPGRAYYFNVNGRNITIREDSGGHFYGPNNIQNRGSHFNDPLQRHYDY